MQLRLQSFFPLRAFSPAEARPADAEIGWHERLITVSAVSLAVLIVASIAVLMSLLD
ncbi:MAG: hypothetical protein ACR2K5_15260 [Pseudolabrys sp.]